MVRVGNDKFQIGQVFQSPRDTADLPADHVLADFNAGLGLADRFRTILTTRGYLSNGNGEGNPTTIYGGTGNDSFTVYHNSADLFLFGEEDDDTFTVRAFVRVNPNDPRAPFTNINGGQGADFISYTVNAPVNIEGGNGFDTITLVGTEFGDEFVVTDSGILGGGLFVRYGSVERVIIDALEGNDTFYIESTGQNVDVQVYGGLGSDTFKVGGGNDGQAIMVVANDLLGHSGLVIHQTTSTDANYLNVFAHGVSANVADSDAPGVVINLISGPIRVFENPTMANSGLVSATYSVVLSRSPQESVQVNAVPTLPKRDEERAGGMGVALNGNLDGATLLFDRTNWFIPQIITVTAPNDSLAEGLRRINIQHSVQQGGSTDDGGEYDKMSVPTVVAEVIDDDAAGVVVAPAADGNVVAESGRNAATSTYQVVLSRPPTGTVTITVNPDPLHLTTQPTSLTFDSEHPWSTPQTVTITAVDDKSVTGLLYSRITHALTAGTLTQFFALTLADVALGLAAKINGDSVAQFTAQRLSGQNSITVTAPDGVAIDARKPSNSPVTFGGTQEAAPYIKDVIVDGASLKNSVWQVTLKNAAGETTGTYSYKVQANDESLANIAKGLKDEINSRNDFVASVLGNTLTIRRVDGTALTVAPSISTPNSTGRMVVQPVTVYRGLTIAVSGSITTGQVWQVVLNGVTYSYTAGANGESTAIPFVDVKVLDLAVAGVFVQETGGSTNVIEPTDIVLLGGGQVRTTTGAGGLIHIVAGPSSPAIVASVAFTSTGSKVSGGQATLSGTPVWLSALVTPLGDVASYPVWELTLSSGDVDKTYQAIATSQSTPASIGAALASQITTGGIYIATANANGIITIALKVNGNVGFTARMTKGRASITGTAAWRVLNIALTGSVAVGDSIKVTLTTGTTQTLTYSVVGPSIPTLSAIASNLAGQVASPLTQSSSALTQFIGDFGTAVMDETPSHDSAATAQPIDFATWGKAANPDIDNALGMDISTTTPHLTIKGAGNGETDFYRFEITDPMLAAAAAAGVSGGINARFDVDHGFDGTGVYWGAQIRLYRLSTVNGNLVATPLLADLTHPNGGQSPLYNAIDHGSTTQLDGALSYAFTTAGSYAVEVINWLGPKFAVNRSIGLPQGVHYDLNISIPFHDVARFTFAPTPVLENEKQQDPAAQGSNSASLGRAQDVDDAKLWFTFSDDTIGNKPTGTIDSSVPYVTILGSGDGSYDEFRFIVTSEMLSRPAGTVTGTLESSHTYYTSVGITLAGPVGTGDRWAATIDGHEFSYTAVEFDDLSKVAAGLVQGLHRFPNDQERQYHPDLYGFRYGQHPAHCRSEWLLDHSTTEGRGGGNGYTDADDSLNGTLHDREAGLEWDTGERRDLVCADQWVGGSFHLYARSK